MRFRGVFVTAALAAGCLALTGGASPASAAELDGPIIGRCEWQTKWWDENIGGDKSYAVACYHDPRIQYHTGEYCMFFEEDDDGSTVCHGYPDIGD